MKKVLYVATVVKTHIMEFHLPYLKMFRELGWETAVAAKNDYENAGDCCIPYCDIYYDVPFERSPLKLANLKAYKSLKRIIDSGEYDIIHCHTPVGGVLTRLAAAQARKRGTKVIYTAHGFHFCKGAPLTNWLLYYPAEKLCSRLTDVLITINREDYALAKRKMKARRIEYIPGVGVELAKFANCPVDRAAWRNEFGIPADETLLLSVGELNRNKNHEAVIRAIADLNVYYIIAGRGELQAYLQKLVDDLGLSDRVKLLGYREDVAQLYKTADVFVFPSIREGLPVALMEAMASGLPVICSGIRGNTDLVQNGISGIICDNSATSLAESILELKSNEALRTRLAAAAQKSVQQYDLNNVLARMKEIFFG